MLGHSFQKTNAAFIAAARPDMVLMTYANVTFPPETVAAFAAVGWQTRNVRGHHPASCAADREGVGGAWLFQAYNCLHGLCTSAARL